LRAPLLLLAAVVAMAGLGNTASREEPLGFSMGMSESALQRIPGATLERAPSRDTFVLRPLAKPGNRFDAFILVVGPHSGLCRFTAAGPEISADKLEHAFSAMRSEFDRIYGGTHMKDSPPPRGRLSSATSPIPANPNMLSATWSATSHATMGKTVQSIDLGVVQRGEGYYLLLFKISFVNQKCD
jgi:hypothetical protein